MWTMAIDADSLLRWLRRLDKSLQELDDYLTPESLAQETDGEASVVRLQAMVAGARASIQGMHSHVEAKRDHQQALEASEGNDPFPSGNEVGVARRDSASRADALREALRAARLGSLARATFRNRGRTTRRRRSRR